MPNLSVAYIGCGAVVERSHLPAILKADGLQATTLADFNVQQVAKLARLYGIENTNVAYTDVLEKFSLAVIATPSASHFEIGRTLLKAGKHLLVEKPLSLTYGHAKELVDIAEDAGLVLAVSLVRRYLPHFRLFKALMSSKIVGNVTGFVIEEGEVFNWPVQSAAFYQHEKSGGGVLMDNGAHLLDLMIWWLGDFENVEYFDDAQGGVEAECKLELQLQSGARGNVTMSRLRQLSNRITVTGDNGTVEMDLGSGLIELAINGAPVINNVPLVFSGQAMLSQQKVKVSTIDLFQLQYNDIAGAISTKSIDTGGLVLGRECLESIRLIEECYAKRQFLQYLAD